MKVCIRKTSTELLGLPPVRLSDSVKAVDCARLHVVLSTFGVLGL